MTGIWEFPEIEDLRLFLEQGVADTLELVEENLRDEGEGSRADVIERMSLERMLVVDEWGRGTAEIGRDPLRVLFFFSVEGIENEGTFPPFDPAARTVVQQFIILINEEILEPPPPSEEWFTRLDPEPRPIDRFADIGSLALGRAEGNTIFDLTRMEAIQFVPPVEPEGPLEERRPIPFEDLPRIPLEQLREERVPPPEEEEEVPPPEPEVEEEPEVIPIEEQIREAITEFEVEDGELEIPAGKPTKRVEIRDLFEFEIRMGLPSNVLGELEGFAPGDQIQNGVGWFMTVGRIGTQVPPATIPRTSSYVRNRLLFEGTTYVLDLYRDLVFYSGFISAFYGMTFKPGSYTSFREFIYRIKEINEREGPELIRPLSQQQASARGLETLPDHPSIEGEKAPWLERRQYYEIVEENADHGAWEDITGYLYDTLPTQTQA